MKKDEIEILIERYPVLSVCEKEIRNAVETIADSFRDNGILFTCGNGGSCADADHIAGEFLKGFIKKRPISQNHKDVLSSFGEEGELLSNKLQCGLRCIPLNDFSSALSAVRNDLDGQMDYAQVLYALANEKSVLMTISTSGNSKNARLATYVANVLNMKTIALVGKDGGQLSKIADISIVVPENETYRIQELHLPIYHAICIAVEDIFFEK